MEASNCWSICVQVQSDALPPFDWKSLCNRTDSMSSNLYPIGLQSHLRFASDWGGWVWVQSCLRFGTVGVRTGGRRLPPYHDMELHSIFLEDVLILWLAMERGEELKVDVVLLYY